MSHQTGKLNLLVIAGAGVGGTEKAAFLFAESLVKRGYRVIALSEPGQARGSSFEAAGGMIVSGSHTTATFLDLIQKHGIHVIHQHVSGYGDHRELYAALDQLGERRPKLIETNVFGQLLDFHENNHVDMRMFVSLTSGVQAFRRTRVTSTLPDINKHTVLFNPLDPDERCEAINRDSFRESLGVSPKDFMAIRVGRPGHKWARWECQAHQLARKQNPNLRLVLMEPTSEIASEIHQGRYGEGLIVLPATSDFHFISALYQSADLMIHASSFGESFGYTLAEAMMAGLPIITRATAWGDNAQTELVTHGITGYVCGSVRGMAAALLELSENPRKCHEMGTEARARIDPMASLERETDLLEEVLARVVTGKAGPLMIERFRKWQEHNQRGYSMRSRKRYEASNQLLFSLVAGNVYESLKCLRSIKLYLRLRSRGKPLVYPSIRF